jgi:hypothetical protein
VAGTPRHPAHDPHVVWIIALHNPQFDPLASRAYGTTLATRDVNDTALAA